MAKRQLNRRQNWRIEKSRASVLLARPNASSMCCRNWKVATWGRNNLPGDCPLWRAGRGGGPGWRRCRPGVPLPLARQPASTGHWRPRGMACRQPGHRRDRGADATQHQLCRPNNHGQLKPVAANVDLIVIVFAPAPEPHPNLIDRYLVAAEHAGLRPLLLLNKADLINAENGPGLQALLEVYRELGYPLLEVSAHHGDGMQRLQQQLTGTSACSSASRVWQVFAGQQPAARGRHPRRRPVGMVGPGHPHHHHRAAVPFPQWRRPYRLAGHPRIRPWPRQPQRCGGWLHRVPRPVRHLPLPRLQT